MDAPSRWRERRAPVKSLGFIFSYLATPQTRRNARVLGWMIGLLAVIVTVYSVLFHVLMAREGQDHSWLTAFYWTLVTMSTLGYGDVAFESDLGRAFSVLVLLSGSAFILVLLPFTFIQFVFVPWMESTQRARAPRRVPDDVRGHVVLTGTGPIEAALVPRLRRAGIPYVSLVADLDEALRLHDEGWKVMVGALDDTDAFRAAGAERAVLVAAIQADTTNTNIAFTVREISQSVKVAATAHSAASVDILELAGCDQVLQLDELLGSALARRVLMPDGRSQVIGQFDELLVAEATAPAALVGKPLLESGLRARTGLSVAGIWDRGRLAVARPASVLSPSSTIVLAGDRDQLDTYDQLYGVEREIPGPVVIIGGGRVGRATARSLARAGLAYRIIEQRPERIKDDSYVEGDAADLAVLRRAGIERTPAVIVTTHEDDVNVYLTIYCRRLRPDVQLIARARLDRNVSTLHRAGADFVLSYASTGAISIWNLLTHEDTLQLAEGLEVFRVPVPSSLAGRTLATAGIRESTGCTVVAVADGGRLRSNPPAGTSLSPGTELVLIGDTDAEHRFLSRYPTNRR